MLCKESTELRKHIGWGDRTRTDEVEGREIYSLLQLPLCDAPIYWHRQKDSNPRLSVLFPIIIGGASAYLKQAWICIRLARLVETDALPTELYRHFKSGHSWTRTTFSGFSVLRIHHVCQVSSAEAERFELSEPFERLGPLAEGWFRPLTHASFILTLQS